MKTFLAFFLLASVAMLPHRTMAQDTAAGKPVTYNGFLSGSYSYNFGRPSTGMNAYRVFDFDDNSFKLDVAELVVQRVVEQANDAGFRLDVTAGASIPRVTASGGLFRGPDGSAEDLDVQQAFVSYIAPLGDGLRIDFGKFVTYAGYELIDGYDGYNDNATRSYLFGYAMPGTHTGVRIGYTASPQFSASAMLVNGWDVVKDNNAAKTFGMQLTLAQKDAPAFLLTYIVGAERAGDDNDVRHLIDIVSTWNINDKVSLGFNADYGLEPGSDTSNRNVLWVGIAGYAKIRYTPKFSIALRGEVFGDPDGARTGVSQTLSEFTISPEYKPVPNIGFRADLRLDFSDALVFDKEGKPNDAQTTFLLNAYYLF